MVEPVMDALAGERRFGADSLGTRCGNSGDVLRSFVGYESPRRGVDFDGAGLDGVNPCGLVGIHETAGENAIYVVGVPSGSAAVIGANYGSAMRNVRASARVVDGAKSSGESRGVSEAVYFLRPVTDRLMSISKVSRIQVHVLQVAVICEGEKGRGLPNRVVERKLDFAFFVSTAELGKGGDG